MPAPQTRTIVRTVTQTFEGNPQKFSMIGRLQDAIETSWAKIPSYYYDVTQYQLPLTSAEFDAKFGTENRLFSLEQNQNAGRQTNAAVGAGVNEPFVALGAGIVAIGEGEAFSLPVEVVDRAAAAAEGCTPQNNGCVSNLQSTTRNGVVYYGGATWRAIEKIFQAFRLRIAINRRFLVVDESLFDVGMSPVPPEFVGASDSLVPAMPFVREVNDVLKAKGFGKIAVPINQAGTLCTLPPMAGVTYGHPRIIGLANRIYCFNKPLIWFPGMTFDTVLAPVENDVAIQQALRAITVLDPSAATTPDEDLSETICLGGTGFSSAFTIPGGTITLGLVLKGYALQPDACVDYLTKYLLPGSMATQMLAGNQAVLSLLNAAANASTPLYARLAGAVDGIDEDVKRELKAGAPHMGPTNAAGFGG